METCNFAYPTLADFLPAAKNVLAFARGTDPSVDLACAMHCGWVCQGVGFSFMPENPAPIVVANKKASAGDLATLEAAIAQLEQKKGATKAEVGKLNINWAQLIQIVLTILGGVLKPI